MPTAKRTVFDYQPPAVTTTHTVAGSPRRQEAEDFVRAVFARRYGAQVPVFAPNLTLFEQNDRVVAATGWRPAGDGRLFLERYLDQPIEAAMAQLAGQPVQRERIVEVGNLAAEKAGSSIHVILTLARHFDRLGHDWVVFTATRELIGIFTRLGLPLLALAPADPARLGDEAAAWGSYYDTQPIVVAGRIRLGLGRSAKSTEAQA
ncbi:thermostable hemolysin [Azospira restricta]|uniref:Thermostable hemolysin n=1 Tax=Azospira restricta TaxID=404405 RepID=A0A974PYL0_9RHOO|nr:thermostable hemolysin [Azospira restricta]QRJ63516.1 thermostable hemolysin [Azospira restricta]